MLERHDRGWGPPRERGRGRHRLWRAVVPGLVVGVVALAGGFSPQQATSPRLQLTSATNPTPPTGVTAAGADRALTVSWTAPAEIGITGYKVYVNGSLAASPAASPATVTGLVNGTTYSVTVSTVTSVLSTSYEGAQSSPVSGVPKDTVAPGAPTGVAAARGDTKVTVTWTANSADYDADGYRVLRGGTAVSGLLGGRSTTTWTDTGLTNDTTYSYAVQTHDTSGNWSASSSPAVSATPTDLTAPAAPTGLAATRGDGRVSLSWTANSEPDVGSYRVWRGGVLVATVTAPTTGYTDTGLTNDTAYSYQLEAVDTHGNVSPPSSPAVSATPTDLTAPAAPTGLVAARGDGRVVLSWSANSESDLASYRVLRGGVEVATVAAGTTGYTDTGLTDDTTYSYALVAVDTHGNRSVSSASVSATPTDLTPPAGPTGLTGGRGDGRAGLSWTANTEPDLASYRVLRGGVEIATVPAGTTSYLDTGLTNDTTYSYALVAVDTHGNRSTTSASVQVTPTDLTPPAAPTGLTAVRGDTRVSLSWTANTEPDLASYRVLRGGVEIATVAAGTTSYTDTGLTNDTSYTYALVAVDTHGNRSVSSASASATPTDLTAPAAPTGLAAVRGDGRVTLSWTANAEADLAAYRVWRGGVLVATVSAPATSYTDTGLTNDTAYSYQLEAVDSHGNVSPPSSPAVSATPTDLTAPAAPTGLAAVRGDGRVSLSWSANPEPDLASYRVLRGGVEIATVAAGTTGYTDTGLTNDTTYSYALVAVDTHGNRSVSSASVSATPTDLTAPAAPTGLAATRADGRVVLSWTANTEPDLASYRVLRGGVEIATVAAGTTGYTDTGLTNDTTYSYALVAVDTHGNRSVSSASVSATPTDLTAPAAPTGLAATRGDGRVSVSWTANSEPDLASYRVLRGGVEIATVAAGTTGYTDTGLTNDTTYSYALVAVDTHGNRSVSSASVSATPTDLTAPAAPTGLAATRGDGRVVLSWTANSEPDLASYRVLRGGVEVATVAAGTTGYTDTGLTNDTTYSYALVAVDTHGNRSVSSASVSATPTDLTAPAAPTGLAATRGDGRVVLSWTANTEPDVASYRVLRGGVEIATVAAGTTGYTDTGLTNDTAYGYQLEAVDTHGNVSPPSSPAVSATPTDLTAPAAPTGLTGARGDGRAGLSWTANTEPDLASYRVLRGGVEIATVLAGTTSYTDTGLTDDTTYSYALVAVDGHGNRSSTSGSVQVTPVDLTPPAVPSGLAATAGAAQVSLSWSANTEPDLASYVLVRGGVDLTTVPAGTMTFTDTAVTGGTTYSYALAAVDTHGNRSTTSAAVSATVTDSTPPAVPTGLSASAGDRQVVLSWSPDGEPDLASYRVLRGGTEVATVPAGTTSWTDTGLQDGTAYTYALTAVDTSGNRSAASTTVSATPVDTTPPSAPTALAATPGDHRVTLTWTAPADPDVTAYEVQRDGTPAATVVSGTGWADTGLTEGVSHTYAVVAIDASGNRSAPSVPVTAAPADTTAPAAPTGLAATPGDRTVGLSWSPNPEPDLASYRVLRDGLEVATVPAGTTSWTDAGLTDGTSYRYALVAVDTAGNRSSASSAVSVTPADPYPPAAPAGLAAAPGDRTVALSWSPNGEPDLATYRVLRGGVEAAAVAAGTTTWTDTAVVNGTAYGYALVAVDTSGNRSTASATVSATPADTVAPGSPTAVSATSGDGTATVRWTAPADADLASYRVLDASGATVTTVAAPAGSATVTGLTNGTTYSFTVVAVDTSGNVSARSAAVSATPAVASVPVQGSGTSGGVAVSHDGRYVVIGTTAQLEASDTNTAYELYLVDRTAHTAHRIAPLPANATGATDPTNTAAPAISDDGRYIALATTAALVPSDRNGLMDVYRYDTTTSTWAVVSVAAGGAPTAAAGTLLQTGTTVYTTSPTVAMSADGDVVLFYSARSDLVAGDTNGQVDLFAKRMSTGVVTRVSTTSTGASIAGVAATGPAMSLTPDGQFALFPVTPTAGGNTLLYRKTLTGAQAGTLTLVSTVTVNGRATSFGVYRDAGDIAISADGRYVALVTANEITTATPASLYTTGLAYRVDTSSGAVLALGNGQTTIWEHQVELDPTGRYGFFSTSSGELAADTNSHTDAYRRDLAGDVAGPLLLVSADASGRPTTGPSGSVSSAEYGRVRAVTGDSVLLTTSQALLPSDTNRVRDLYAKDLVSGAVSSAL